MEDKENKDGQIEVYSTKLQIEDFKESLIWADIKRELEIWAKGFDIEMKQIVDEAATTNPSTASVLMHMGDLNGRMKAIRYVLNLPDLFLNILEDKKNDSSS
jgi:hypothetical protein